MAKYQRMDANMFADHLYKMEDNTSVVFAVKSSKHMEIGSVTEDEDSLEYFWYAKKVWEEQYDSWYIVIDYITGGKAMIIPLDWSENAMETIRNFLTKYYWNKFPAFYVEIEEAK